MPSSNLNLAHDIVWLVHQVPHAAVLDIGPGNGKFGLLLREYLNEKPERLDCVEAEPSYIEKFHWLPCLYDNVYQGDGAALDEETLNTYDVVMLNDVIEHIEKQAALDLLGRIRGRVVIATPVDFFTQHVEGVPSEDHVSHWTVEDFQATGRVEVCYHKLGGIICRLGPRQ